MARKRRTADAIDRDTIVAIATPPGRGGVGIVRVSGALALPILRAICGRDVPARRATVASFSEPSGETIDRGIVLRYVAPQSFTGEDVVEFQGHGGPVVMDLLVNAVLAAGARLARPGEFTERAFHNGKLDLAQAEAVADLIASGSAAAARSALKSLSGEFSRQVSALAAEILDLRVFIEAALDFAEEEIDLLSGYELTQRLERLVGSVDALTSKATQGAILNEGITVVLAGRPNVGKSSLLNRLLGYDRAIVTSTPGTTRDVLAETMDIEGVPVRVVDTAGLRFGAGAIEQEGIRRAQVQIESADQILLVCDATDREPIKSQVDEFHLPIDRLLVVRNKIDLVAAPGPLADADPYGGWIDVSALTGIGVDTLVEHIQRTIGYQPEDGVFSARRRHLVALDRARGALLRGVAGLSAGAPELLAEDLRHAHECLGEIVGAVSSEELLGEIFSRFCIGK